MKHLAFLFLFIGTFPLFGQDKRTTTSFSLGVIEEIESVVLGEKRKLNIYLPRNYHPDSAKTYPVIYLLDGSADEDFIHIAGLVQFFNMIQEMPETIVVGIANVDRKRDFTFPTTIEKDQRDFPGTGSSAKFIAFLETELQPFIHKKFKTVGPSTLIGQSLGGLLATEILLKKPHLFDQYLIVSPSLWWDNESLLKSIPDLRAKLSGKIIRVHISVGKEGSTMEKDAKDLYKKIKDSGKANIQATFEYLEDENHANVLHESIYRAFKALGKD